MFGHTRHRGHTRPHAACDDRCVVGELPHVIPAVPDEHLRCHGERIDVRDAPLDEGGAGVGGAHGLGDASVFDRADGAGSEHWSEDEEVARRDDQQPKQVGVHNLDEGVRRPSRANNQQPRSGDAIALPGFEAVDQVLSSYQ